MACNVRVAAQSFSELVQAWVKQGGQQANAPGRGCAQGRVGEPLIVSTHLLDWETNLDGNSAERSIYKRMHVHQC